MPKGEFKKCNRPITEQRKKIFLQTLAKTGSLCGAAQAATPWARGRRGGWESSSCSEHEQVIWNTGCQIVKTRVDNGFNLFAHEWLFWNIVKVEHASVFNMLTIASEVPRPFLNKVTYFRHYFPRYAHHVNRCGHKRRCA